ncbi:MAG: DEAD/DEAH box helicase [Bacteroidales bacterium]|nr:DEAD/DEAH box helicase [Bacteroidales bacterium]
MNFKELRVSTPLLNALEDLEIVYPTPIQEKTYRRITAGSDLVGIAQTGTGKTFAYLLPILNELEYSKQQHPRILIIVPTRELVLQVKEEAEKLSRYKNVRIKEVFGGTNINTQKEYIYDGGADIIIGTPGRLFDIAVTGILKLNKIKKVVIDEVDETLSLGFRPQIEQLLEMMPQKKQNLMFSATLSDEVDYFINKYFFDPIKIEIDNNITPTEKIDQQAFNIPNFNTKIEFLKHILINNDDLIKNLIFVSTKKQADYLFEKLNPELGSVIGVIHSNKSQNYRFNTIKNFQKGSIKTIIATDVVAKGLDFNDISHVISLTVPDNPLDYIHRIGRTGRADKNGSSILMVSPYEANYYQEILKIVGANIKENEIPDTVKVSKILMEDEKPSESQKNYLKTSDLKNSGGAFHAKSKKRQKINSGGLKKKSKKKKN